MTLHRYSTDPDPVRAAVGDLLAHLLASCEAQAVDDAGGPAYRLRQSHAALGLVLQWLMDPRMFVQFPEINEKHLAAPLLDLADAL
jgi:hypothetical protein